MLLESSGGPAVFVNPPGHILNRCLTSTPGHWSSWSIDGSQRLRDGALSLLVVLTVSGATSVWAQNIGTIAGRVEFSVEGDTTHVEFQGPGASDLKMERVEAPGPMVRVSVPGSWTRSLNVTSWTSDAIQKVDVVDGGGVADRATLVFHLRKSAFQVFDYTASESGHRVFDFFLPKAPVVSKKAPAVAAENAATLPPKKVATGVSSKKQNSTKLERKPASDIGPQVPKALDSLPADSVLTNKAGVFDGSDPEFERLRIRPYEIRPEAIQASKQNVYLPFPMLEMPYAEIDDIVSSKPVYHVVPGPGEENEQARFLLHLFEKGRHAAFLKSYKVFKKKFPESRYHQLLEYIFADIHLARFYLNKENSDFETAINTYSELMVRFPESSMYDRTAILVANSYFRKGEYVRALRMFQKFTNEKPESPHRDVVQLAMAHAFAGLNQFDSAKKTLELVAANARKPQYASEARFRIGDMALVQRKYNEAAALYLETIKQHPGEVALFPNVYFNLGESQFWLGQYAESAESLRLFLKGFPTHPYASYALTRVAELMEILGVDKKRSHATYMESYFRYFPQPGAKLARTRLHLNRLGEMKKKEYDSAMAEMEEFSKTEVIPGLSEFMTLAVTDAQVKKGELTGPLKTLIEFHQLHPTNLNLQQFRNRISRILVEEIRQKVEKGDFLAALKQYQQDSTLWLKTTSRRDLDFALSQSFEKAGVFDEAQERYQALSERLTKSPITEDVFDSPPSVESVHLRLARVRLEQNQFAAAVQDLQKVGSGEKLSPAEQIERNSLAVQIFRKTGQNAEAERVLSEMIQGWKGEEFLLAEPLVLQAELAYGQSRFPDVILSASRAVELLRKKDFSEPELALKAYKILADANVRAEKVDEAIGLYRQAISSLEGKASVAEVQYRLGLLQFERGNLREAESVWGGLSAQTDPLWWKMAQDQMKQDKFRASYQKYMDRIPAMKDMKKTSSESN